MDTWFNARYLSDSGPRTAVSQRAMASNFFHLRGPDDLAGRSARTSRSSGPRIARPTFSLDFGSSFPRFSYPRARPSVSSSSVNMWCIVGCDPDVGGALAVITGDDVGNVELVRIFDCPTKPVDVNGRARMRVCVDGMAAFVRELDLPPGTVAHLEVRRVVDNAVNRAWVKFIHFFQTIAVKQNRSWVFHFDFLLLIATIFSCPIFCL